MTPDETSLMTQPATVPIHDISSFLRWMLQDIKSYARREPTQAIALAVGVGLLVNLVPTRVVAGTVSTVGAALLRPILISLGITKAIELTCNVTPLTLKP